MNNYIFYVFAVFTLSIQLNAQPNFPNDPNDAILVSVDVKNFIHAYNTLSKDSDSVRVIQSLYIDKGSEGLKEYIRRFQLTSESMVKAIGSKQQNYEKLKDFYADILKFELTYTKEMVNYKKVINQAVFPPTYLLVTDFKGIANGSTVGQLVSLEKRLDKDILLNTIIHELTHFQQVVHIGFQDFSRVYSKEDNMLDLILREGAAEFVTYKLVRQNVDQFEKLKNYEKNERELWEKFKTDLNSQNKFFWLSVSYENNNNGNPIQLGYGLGYKIVEAYYNQVEDKAKAINKILSIKDASEFFKKSNYAPK